MNRLHEGLVLGDRYSLSSRIASGGMGDVWEADDTGSVKAAAKLEERVAEGRRLRLEARAARTVGDAGSGYERGRGQQRRTSAADEPAYELEPLPSQTAHAAGRTTR